MCNLDRRTWKLKRPRIVYKFAPRGGSEYRPGMRSFVDGYPSRGRKLNYEVGKTVVSPSGPGIMAYERKPRAGQWGYLILRIPKGATIRRGTGFDKGVIAASKVVVVGPL